METPIPAPAPSVPPYDPYQQPAGGPPVIPGDPYAQQARGGSSCGKACLYGGLVVAGLVALGIGGCAYFVRTGGIEQFAQRVIQQNLPEGSDVQVGNLQEIAKKVEEGKNAPPPSIMHVEGFVNGWISDVPLYPGAVPTEDGRITLEGKDGHTATLTSPDAFVRVYDWYRIELDRQGWAIPMAYSTSKDSTAFIAAAKGERIGTVTCETKNGTTTIILSFSTT